MFGFLTKDMFPVNAFTSRFTGIKYQRNFLNNSSTSSDSYLFLSKVQSVGLKINYLLSSYAMNF